VSSITSVLIFHKLCGVYSPVIFLFSKYSDGVTSGKRNTFKD